MDAARGWNRGWEREHERRRWRCFECSLPMMGSGMDRGEQNGGGVCFTKGRKWSRKTKLLALVVGRSPWSSPNLAAPGDRVRSVPTYIAERIRSSATSIPIPVTCKFRGIGAATTRCRETTARPNWVHSSTGFISPQYKKNIHACRSIPTQPLSE